jgi:hypothetical protein
LVTSARLVDVPAGGLNTVQWRLGGLGGREALSRSPVKRYCEVTGYVAPQNKFNVRLPLPADWNRKFYAYPYIPGTETEWERWNFPGPLPGSPTPQHFNFKLAQQFQSYMADEQPRRGVDPFKFDFDKDPATFARARKIYDATSHDLRAFKARGGEILPWHGLADGGIMATSSIGYYDGVAKQMGGRRQTEDFFRLFLIPGTGSRRARRRMSW